MTDRWRITPPPYELDREAERRAAGKVIGQDGATLDPYNQNLLKGDLPIFGKDWFLNFTGISDTLAESRTLPTPSGVSAVKPHLDHRLRQRQPESLQRKPHRLVRSFPGRHRLQADRAALQSDADREPQLRPSARERPGQAGRAPRHVAHRCDTFALQEFFYERKLADLSPNYDFISFRAGSQPFNSDFRGFIFNDTNLGVRALRQLRVQSLPVQPGSVRPAGERHQLRPQHNGAPRSAGRHRQPLLAGLPRPRLHAAVQLPLRPRRGHASTTTATASSCVPRRSASSRRTRSAPRTSANRDSDTSAASTSITPSTTSSATTS